MSITEYALLVSLAEYAIRMLRKEGCRRESLKKMVDRVCNEVPRGKE